MNCQYCQQPFVDVSYLLNQRSLTDPDSHKYQILQCTNHQSVIFRISIDLDINKEVYRLFMISRKQMWYGLGIIVDGKSDAFEIRKYSQAGDDPNLFTQHEFVAGFPFSAFTITANNVLSKLQTILLFL